LSSKENSWTHVISDFDGTISVLNVDWTSLRTKLKVKSIEDLLCVGIQPSWNILRTAELDGVQSQWVSSEVRTILQGSTSFSVFTNNDQDAVEEFFSRQQTAAKPSSIIDRKKIEGSKKVFEKFKTGITLCMESMGCISTKGVLYLGDSDYEMSYARKIGLETRLVAPNGDLVNETSIYGVES
jgi:hypothetical protein